MHRRKGRNERQGVGGCNWLSLVGCLDGIASLRRTSPSNTNTFTSSQMEWYRSHDVASTARKSFESDSTASDATLDEKDPSDPYRAKEGRNGNGHLFSSSPNHRFRDSEEMIGQEEGEEEEQVGLMQLDRRRQRVSGPYSPHM